MNNLPAVIEEPAKLELEKQLVGAVIQPVTAAQAKIDAVASLTLSAYQKAATLEITPEESAKLQADFPDAAFQTGAAGKESLIYIEHAHLRDRFNEVFGMGKWAIVPRNRWAESFTTAKGTPGERVYVEAMLVVRGCFVGEAVGAMEYYPKNESQNYGDAVEGAKTAAFRRCAKEFGVGLQAWKKEYCEGWWSRKRGVKPSQSVSTPPKTPEPVKSVPKATPEAPAPAKKADVLPKEATEATRKWFLDQLVDYESAAVLAYMQEINWLMPTETFQDLPLRFVPTSKDQLRHFMERFEQWRDGDVAPTVQKEPVQLPDSRERVTGVIAMVSKKEGQSKKGPWTLYGIKVNDTFYNTFDHKIGAAATERKGAEATVFFEQTERGFNALEVV